jgi:hypothetical protein
MSMDSKELSDTVPNGRLYLDAPGSNIVGKGQQMLYWNSAGKTITWKE